MALMLSLMPEMVLAKYFSKSSYLERMDCLLELIDSLRDLESMFMGVSC